MMHKIGTATDHYGPVIKLGKSFNGLTAENLSAMQKELKAQEDTRHAESVTGGSGGAPAPRKLDEVSSFSSVQSSKRAFKYQADPGLQLQDTIKRKKRRYVKALGVCRERFAPCSTVYMTCFLGVWKMPQSADKDQNARGSISFGSQI